MILFSCLGIIGSALLLAAYIISKKILRASIGDKTLESFVMLLSQSINGFNHRMVSILIQLIVVSNVLLFIITQLKSHPVDIMLYLALDTTIIVFTILIVVMLKMIPQSLSYVFSAENKSVYALKSRILLVGSFQTFTFFGVFMMMVYILLSIVNAYAFIALSSGVLIISFYYRFAGGVFKAAAESNQKKISNEQKILTHPNEILSRTGDVITSVGGYYLDIFSSWMISIAAFFTYVALSIGANLMELIMIPEVKWVFAVICCTGISTLCSVIIFKKKNTRNIFLDIGYFICGASYIQIMIATRLILVESKLYYGIFISIALILMLGIAFFTNYLTSSQHQPVRFIAKQAQFGGENVLISSFFNGIIGNAIFILLILIILVSSFKVLGLVGLMLIIIYALSIAVIACGIKIFSVITNQTIGIIELQDDAIIKHFSTELKKVAYTLVSIGNTFSSAAGLLSSTTVLALSMSLITGSFMDNSIDFIFGIGLGIIAICVFYGLTISGTYTTLIASGKEVLRQIKEIPHILEKNKAHPNIIRLSEQHSVNGLKAITLPGMWIVICLILIYLMISQQGFYGALIGMFLTVLIQSFFWSLFGDTVASSYALMKDGLYGGDKTNVFERLKQSYYYAHYFQWILAPSGVIIMKFIGMIALLILLI